MKFKCALKFDITFKNQTVPTNFKKIEKEKYRNADLDTANKELTYILRNE